MKLEIGDLLIGTNDWGSTLVKITRVTDARAYTEKGPTFYREYENPSCIRQFGGGRGWNVLSWEFGTEAVLAKFRAKQERDRHRILITDPTVIYKLPLEALRDIVKIIRNAQEKLKTVP